MDQLKVFLRQAVRHRFWIAIGFSVLLPLIGYFVGSGPIQQKAKAETDTIVSTNKDAQQYTSGNLPNAQWKPLVDAKTEILSKDVLASWTKLYERQAPLLSWPELVHERFTTWGRKWPEDVDANLVQRTITDYVEAYPPEVDKVYASFRPWDPMKGEGVVAAPPKESLLRPAPFDIASPPSLGKVWAAQERLWVQRTLLEVVAEVNKSAKDWDEAYIKQVNLLEVGNPVAQDQRSIAKGETLEEAPDLSPDGEVSSADAPADGGEMGGGEMSGMMAGYAGRMMGGGGMGMPGSSESVYYIQNENTQYKVLPVKISVLIDQNHIQDLLVALENSPMAVQVMDFEWNKPNDRVVKPEKGQMMNFAGYGGMGMGMEGMMGGMEGMMGGMEGMTGYAGMMGRMGMEGGSMEGMSGMMGMGMGGLGAQAKGTDIRNIDRRKERKDKEKADQKKVVRSIQDPYYYIVEVVIHGQARFYNPPPKEEPVESTASEAEMATDPSATPADPAATPADPVETPADPGKAEAPATEAPKAEEPKTEEPKAEEPKAEAPAAEGPKA